MFRRLFLTNESRHYFLFADEFGNDMQENGELDTSLPLELAESMAALNAFGGFGGNEEQPHRRSVKNASSGGEREGATRNDHHSSDNMLDDLHSDRLGDSDGQEEASSSVHYVGDETLEESADFEYSLDAGDQELTPERLSRPSHSFTPSPPSREKEPTAVARTANDDAYATTDDDATEDGKPLSDGRYFEEQEDSVDHRVDEDALTEADESLSEHDAEYDALDGVQKLERGMSEEEGLGNEEDEDDRDIVRTDTDLSGISDPINDLSEQNLEIKNAPSGLDDFSELNGASQEDHDEEGDGDGESATSQDDADDKDRPSTPPKADLAVQIVAPAQTPTPAQDATQAAAFSSDVGKYFNDISDPSGADNDEKERPSVWLSKLLADESLITVNVDAERIVLMEDTDLKPVVQEPELDGEPAFLYGKKRRAPKSSDTDAGVALASTVKPVPPTAPGTVGSSGSPLDSAPTLPIPTKSEEHTGKSRSTDPPGKPPLPSNGPERAPQKRSSAPQEADSEEASALGNKKEQVVSTHPSSSRKGDSETKTEAKLEAPVGLLRGWSEPSRSEPSQTESQSSVGEVADLPADASALPDARPILARGNILTRSSLRSLVMKKWHSSFWVRYGPASLLVFRSKDDFEDWLNNPYHSQRQRDYLVKARLDFFGEMKKPDVRGFKMTDIKLKSYEKKGRPMHNFKLEKWTNLGVSLVAAFASADLAEVEAVRDAVSQSLEMCPSHGLRNIEDLLAKTASERAQELISNNKGLKDP